MWAFGLLGLTEDADERSIKRAYAQRLRGTRPDEDPAGFQRLREAYEAALRFCQNRTVQAAVHDGDDGQDEAPVAMAAAPANTPVHARPVALPPRAMGGEAPLPATTVDLAHLLDELLAVAGRGDPQALLAWLAGRHELWSLQAKAALGQRMMARVQQQATAMPAECFDALLGFFDLDHVRAGYDPFAVQRLRRRMRLQWEMQPEHIEAAARRAHDPGWSGHAPNLKMTRRMLRQLVRPFHWPQVLLVSMLPERPGELARFANRLSDDHVEELLPYMPREQLHFWLLAAARGLSLPRLAINSVRIVTATVAAIALVAALFGVITLGGDASKAWNVFPTIAAWICGVAGLAFAYMGWQWLDYWQRLPDMDGGRGTWLRWACVPLMAAIAVALKYLGVDELASVVIVVLAIVLGIRRYRERSGAGPSRFRIHPVGWIVLANMLRLALSGEDAPTVPLAEIGATIAMAFWLADAWKERGRRRASAAAA